MYHCHFTLHEDAGMMGQFVVVDSSAQTDVYNLQKTQPEFLIYPNPCANTLFVSLKDPSNDIYYAIIRDADGRAIYMLPKPDMKNGINVSSLPAGIYIAELTDTKTKTVASRQFVKK
jgi:hypothetical protein